MWHTLIGRTLKGFGYSHKDELQQTWSWASVTSSVATSTEQTTLQILIDCSNRILSAGLWLLVDEAELNLKCTVYTLVIINWNEEQIFKILTEMNNF